MKQKLSFCLYHEREHLSGGKKFSAGQQEMPFDSSNQRVCLLGFKVAVMINNVNNLESLSRLGSYLPKAYQYLCRLNYQLKTDAEVFSLPLVKKKQMRVRYGIH